MIYTLKMKSLYGTKSIIGRTQESVSPESDTRVAPFTMNSNESLSEVLFVPITLQSAGLEVLIPKGIYFCQDSLN